MPLTVRTRRATARLSVIAATLLTGAAVVPSSLDAPAGASASLCQKVSTSVVSAALGVKATKVATTINGSVTVCWYRVGANTHGAFVRTQTSDNSAGFTADRKLAAKYGENPKADAHFAPYPAFSTSIGSASYGYTYSVTILKKSTELGVGAAKTSLAKVEALAKKVLAKI